MKLHNYWLARIALKKEVVKRVRQAFVPPIYRKAIPKTKP